MMMSRLVLACVLAVPVAGVRVVKKAGAEKGDLGTVSVECEYERIAVMLTAGGDTEVGECVDKDGTVYDVSPKVVDWAEHHDVLSLELQAQATVSVLGEQEYKVLSAGLVRHAEEGPSMANNGYSILAVRSVWRDGESATFSQLRPNLDQAKALIKRSSYGKFNIGATTRYATAQVSSRYGSHNGTCKARDIREQIIPNTAGVNNYMYRMFFIPGVQGCGWAGLATVGCGRPSSSPRNGACWSMYHGGGNFGHSIITQAHELGHNLGLLHAAGLRRGDFVEYGDETAIMGNKWMEGMEYSAAHRFQLGWLRERSEEVTALSRGARRLSKLEAAIGGAWVALRIACNKCVPRQEDKSSNIGGELFVSYAYGLVRVHLRRVNSKGALTQGTELWESLDAGGSFANSYGPSVYVCAAGNRAKVAVGRSVSDARGQCR